MLVQRTASAQVVTTLAGSGERGSVDGNGAEASFSDPSGLAVDRREMFMWPTRGNNKIRKITPSGTVTTLAGSGEVGGADGRGTAASFRFPSAISVDTSGNVYVTEESSLVLRGRLGRGHPENHGRRRGHDSGGAGTVRDVGGRRGG